LFQEFRAALIAPSVTCGVRSSEPMACTLNDTVDVFQRTGTPLETPTL
jgi:hypothetical protein